jgi:hypothetical protein
MVCLILTMSVAAKPKPAPDAAVTVATRPAPGEGSWEIITCGDGPAMTIVKFFDDHQRLIYEEHLDGVRLDGSRRKVQRRLNKSLRTALVAWESNWQVRREQGFVAALFR